MAIYTLKLLDRYNVARNTIVFVFTKPAGLTYQPGQYGGFTLINPKEKDAGGITRRFSLLSSPDDDYLAIVTRIQNSAYKRELNALTPGAEIKFAGPTGTFTLHEPISIPAVLIAGGIGIAPFYSMIRYTTAHHKEQKITLFYGNQAEEDAPFLSELNELKQQNKGFMLVTTFVNPPSGWQAETGYITETMIKKYLTDLTKPYYYVCGSPAMVTTLQETLVEMGIPDQQIKVEDFPGY